MIYFASLCYMENYDLFSGICLEVSRREFFEEWVKYDKNLRNSKLYKYLSRKYNLRNIGESSIKEIKHLISLYSSKMLEKWKKCFRRRDIFFERNEQWLGGENFCFKVEISWESDREMYEPQPSTSGLVGRPKVEFDEASLKTKKRRVQDLVSSRSTQELALAAEVSVRESGQKDAADLIKAITRSSPKRASHIKQICRQVRSSRLLTSDEALAYYVDSKLTTHSYKNTRKWTMKAGHYVFPSYYALRKSKLMCLPKDDYVLVTDTTAEINLQAILNLTAERLVKAQKDVIENFSDLEFTLISKWGCDGSSGHSRYKQKFVDETLDDEYMILFSFVPITLHKIDNINERVWQIPRPSSTMFCRPIKFIFAKEDDKITKSECEKILIQIEALQPSKIQFDNKEITVDHKLLFTMVDGKVCNALTDTKSTQRCYICNATPKFMNQRDLSFVDNEENYGFGLSTLHAWIRCFECFLHISYRLNIKKWRIQGDNDKDDVEKRKSEIQSRFKQEMGLIVDKPKPSYGSTNDGNTARKFFRNAEISANITGLDVNLIKKVCVLLQTLSSQYKINVEKFAEETRQLYLNLYPWYNMPVTLHKILIHSKNIINTSLLPIGQLSEEAQEARNKDCRRFREHHTQKTSRVATNKDLIAMLLITSDPLINSLRDIPRKHASALPPEVLNLLIVEDEPITSVTEEVTVSVDSHNEQYFVSDSSEYDIDDSSSDE